jgi:hypothetical protein
VSAIAWFTEIPLLFGLARPLSALVTLRDVRCPQWPLSRRLFVNATRGVLTMRDEQPRMVVVAVQAVT